MSLGRPVIRIVAITAVTFVMMVPHASAITNGSPDNDGHPNVGALLVHDPAVGWRALCSGSLIAPAEFLTAGHCTAFLDSLGLGVAEVAVTFDADLALNPVSGSVDPAHRIATTGWVTHPGLRLNAAKAYDDVGVVHLASAQATTPVDLPVAGYLDRASLASRSFTNVGYGLNGVDRSLLNPRATVEWFGQRYVSTSPFRALTPYFLKLSENAAATGEGGSCAGDSGGPHFPSPSSNLTVAVTTAGDPSCVSLDENQRLDTPTVVRFLANYAG
jgi:hypothetical protein